MISIKNLTKEYGQGNTLFYAIKDLTLDIADNEFVAIIGKSGSGKSTLLNLIGTLDRATSGNIIIDGSDIAELKKLELAEFRNKNIGFVFQNFYLEPEYSVYENIEIPLILSGNFGKKNREKIEKVLKEVNLIEKIDCKTKTLSGGEQQRVAIARAIINNPMIILADEPCGNLDTQNSENIMQIFKKLHSNGRTVIMVTHDEHDAETAQRIITLSDGRIIKDEKNN